MMDTRTLINNFFTNKYLSIALTIVILVLCIIPSKRIPLATDLNDKVAHFLAFSAWAFCWQAAFGKYYQTIVLGIIYGIFIEFVQSILPESFHRSFDWYDALADGIGVLIGVGLWKIKGLVNL